MRPGLNGKAAVVASAVAAALLFVAVVVKHYGFDSRSSLLQVVYSIASASNTKNIPEFSQNIIAIVHTFALFGSVGSYSILVCAN